MKKRIFFIFLCIALMLTLTACSSFSISANSVGKDNTSAKKMAQVIQEELTKKDQNSDFVLYAIEMSMDTEDIGKAKLIYTDKLPQNLKYSDITVVTVDTRTGKIESVEDADFSQMGAAPYENIVDGAPLGIENWKKDSDEALTIAKNTFYSEENFVYNYVQISSVIQNEICQYKVTFISFVNNLQYSCHVDGMTGAVFGKEVNEL